jgi:tetratricopeptide (TPR) repeat protein
MSEWMRQRRLAAALVAGIALAGAPLRGQHSEHRASSATADTGIALFNNLGPYARRITTRSPLAQQYFDQGMRLAWGFARPEARRSFEAALRADSSCAMCHWGLAWTLGPYVNGQMDSASGVRAYRQAQLAVAKSSGTSAVERALIDALRHRYVAAPDSTNRRAADTAYMKAMREVARRYPKDLDVLTLFGESIMVLRPWDYWTRAGAAQPGIDELLQSLERVLAADLRHPGACHLYIHAVEASTQPGRAERCSDLLIDEMPGASHMRHMPSHLYMRIGRYGDGVRSNQLARIADQQAAHGGATATYPMHNLHMLLFAASYDGQSAIAIQAARDLAAMERTAAHHLPLTLARFGRWSDILQLPVPDRPFQIAMWNYARGLAQLRSDQRDNAVMSLASLDAAIGSFPSKPRRIQMRLARAVLSAEIDAAAKKYDDAIRTLESARTLEVDSLSYDEPEEWVLPLRQVLGAILLEAGRPGPAEQAYRGELEAHPENGWSLIGLQRALEAQGKAREAAAVDARFRRAWQRADVFVRASRF